MPLLRLLPVLLAVAALAAADEATAHAPRFADTSAWPAVLEAQQAAYAREQWPAAPVLVWTGKGRAGDAADPANWQAEGAAAAQGAGPETDVVFPDGVQAVFKEKVQVRHLTVGAKARTSFSDIDIGGNLWVRRGGGFARTKGTFGLADRNTFCRSDNDKPLFLLNMLKIAKKPGVATEWVGKWTIGDEVSIASGDMVIAPGSLFQHTDRREVHVYTNGALVLMSGATWESRGNLYKGNDMVVDGRLLAGTRERPLRSDCTIGLSFKPQGAFKEQSMAMKGSAATDVGLVVMPGATLAVASADPTQARLVFRWHRHPQVTHAYKDGEPPALAALPHGIAIRIFGTAELDGVRFDDVLPGGIQLADPGVRGGWRNVTWGEGNHAAPDALIVPWKGPVPAVGKTSGGRS